MKQKPWGAVVRGGVGAGLLVFLAACATQGTVAPPDLSSKTKEVTGSTNNPSKPWFLSRLLFSGKKAQPTPVGAIPPPAPSAPAKPVPAVPMGPDASLTLFTKAPSDPSIQLYIDYFRYADHQRFKEWLERSHEYLPYIQKTFRETGVPVDLAYVSLIESGFSTRAYSRTGAAGLWQFMRGTGAKYGLTINWWIDQRRDPILSTRSAALYLRDLYSEFHSWELALAAYNAGEGRVANAVARCETKDYWKIRQTRALSAETRNYIPKLIAAALIAKDPAKYGFTDLSYHPAVNVSQKMILHPVEIRRLAQAMKMSTSEFLVYNPQFTRWATPPRSRSVSVNIPQDVLSGFSGRLAMLPETKVDPNVPVYRVESGDSLWSIAHRFHVTIRDLVAANRLVSRSRLRLRQKLIIPRRSSGVGDVALLASYHKPRSSENRLANSEGWIDHRIRRGDSLYLLARRYNTSIEEIRSKNHIRRIKALRVGRHILIPSR